VEKQKLQAKSPEIDGEKKPTTLEEALFWDRKRGARQANQQRHVKSEQEYLKDIRSISGKRMVISGKCPCGKHKGIQYFNGDTPTSEVMCPAHIYLIMMRKDNRERTTWAIDNPFPEWAKAMGMFVMKSFK
jgi:hypothetical protein